MTVRVLICDDQELVRVGIRMIVDSQPDLAVAEEAADGAAAVEAALRVRPDLVLMDVRMPTMDGIEATAKICAALPDTRVLIITTFDLDEYAYSALRAGASGFLVKDAPADEMLVAMRGVLRGDSMVSPSVTRRLLDRYLGEEGGAEHAAKLVRLTEREKDVLGLIARGRSNGEIAEQLYIGETTVKTHVGRVLAKLELRDRVHAVVFAYESGLVRPGS
ncbi:response regulator [Amycolatopsis magusensis]|uniref:response regulator n=1 Tax=Amycolatopsis magusensis TaxID=882444 RepID=UPI003C3042E3